MYESYKSRHWNQILPPTKFIYKAAEKQSHRTYETGQGRRRLAEIMSMTSDIKAEYAAKDGNYEDAARYRREADFWRYHY